MEFNRKLFASKVRGARAELGLTQPEFASEIGVNTSTLVDYEKDDGTYTPGVDKIVAICSITGMSPSELLGWTPSSRRRHIA